MEITIHHQFSPEFMTALNDLTEAIKTGRSVEINTLLDGKVVPTPTGILTHPLNPVSAKVLRDPDLPAPMIGRRGRPLKASSVPSAAETGKSVTAPAGPSADAAESIVDFQAARAECRVLINAALADDMSRGNGNKDLREKIKAAFMDINKESAGKLSQLADEDVPAALAALKAIVPVAA